MSDLSKQLLQEAFDTLPEGLEEFIDIEIPPLDYIAVPTDVDAAIVAQGVLAANINAILQEFQGLHLLQVFMHIAQHNEVLQLLGGVAIQAFRSEKNFEITQPTNTTFANNTEQTFEVHILQGVEKVVWAKAVWSMSEENEISLSLNQDETDPAYWSASWLFQETVVGAFTITFTVAFGSETSDQLTDTLDCTLTL